MVSEPTTPNHARVYDFFLGGKTDFEVDRMAADQIAKTAPDTPVLARELRQFLTRVVRTLAEAGVRQFIDLGTGIPTSPSVHEVARTVPADARVVYVDYDPVVVVHADALLATDAGVKSIEGDIRRPAEILEHSFTSAAYCASPVTLAGPSIRGTRLPIWPDAAISSPPGSRRAGACCRPRTGRPLRAGP